jgi:predicted enzyme related to lactoylglutathione lyase
MSYSTGMFCWNEIGTRDTAAANKFYTELFGWGGKNVPMPDDCGTYTLFQIDGKDVAGLYEMSGPKFEGIPPHWMVYIWTDDTDASAAMVKKLGGQVLHEPFDVPGVGRMAVCQDPTGAVFSLFKGAGHAGEAEVGLRHGAFCWRELMTKNPDVAGKFYTDLFNWGTKGSDGSPIPYTEFQMGGKSIAGMMQLTEEWGDIPSHWGLYVHVDDCDAAAAKAESLGAKIVVPPKEIPEVGKFSVLIDPTGAGISIIKLKASG